MLLAATSDAGGIIHVDYGKSCVEFVLKRGSTHDVGNKPTLTCVLCGGEGVQLISQHPIKAGAHRNSTAPSSESQFERLSTAV